MEKSEEKQLKEVGSMSNEYVHPYNDHVVEQ